MKKPFASAAAMVSVVTVCLVGPAAAHHSFASYDQTQHQLVEGRVTDWHYNNPHSWLHIEVVDENGEVQKWSFEGGAPVHATRQGVTGDTFRKGEFVRVIMSPIRDGRSAGAMCFVVKEDGTVVRPNDGICNAISVIETWKSNGWFESTRHLDTHPVPPR